MINQLSSSDWIAILTLIITSIISIVLYQRIRKKKIIFLEKNHVQINNVDFSKINGLEMIYKNENITQNLYYISGTLIMIGDEDIEESDIKHPVSMVLHNSNGKWKSCNILNKTTLLNCTPEIDDSKLKFVTQEIKNNDFVKFDSVYNSSKKGAKFYHRIHNVNHHVEVIDEKEENFYKVLVAICSMVVLLLVFTIAADFYPRDDNYIYVGKQKIQKPIKVTERSKIEPLTKDDSLILKSLKYEHLYTVNGQQLKTDSIFVVNRKLNERKNKIRQKSELKALDSSFAGKNTSFDIFKKKLEKDRINRKTKLYYENDWSISDKTDSIIQKLLQTKSKITNESKFKINDSISVSYVQFKSNAYNDSTTKTFEISFLIFRILFILFFSVMIFIWIYKLYLLNKYKRVVNN